MINTNALDVADHDHEPSPQPSTATAPTARGLERTLATLWDRRIADTTELARLGTRVDNLEATVEAAWDVLTRLHGLLAGLDRSLTVLAEYAQPPATRPDNPQTAHKPTPTPATRTSGGQR